MMNLMGRECPFDCQNVENTKDALELENFDKGGIFFDFKPTKSFFDLIFDLGIGKKLAQTLDSIKLKLFYDFMK